MPGLLVKSSPHPRKEQEIAIFSFIPVGQGYFLALLRRILVLVRTVLVEIVQLHKTGICATLLHEVFKIQKHQVGLVVIYLLGLVICVHVCSCALLFIRKGTNFVHTVEVL